MVAKRVRMLTLGVAIVVACIGGGSSAMAAKADGKKAKKIAAIIAKYDKDGNGVIDGDEKEAIRKDFAADPKGELAQFDTDHDGKLSDEEIAAIKPPAGGGKKKTDQEKTDGAKSAEGDAPKGK